MRKFSLFTLLLALLVSLFSTVSAEMPPVMEWSWLVEQLASGAETVKIPNNMVSDGTPLRVEGTVSIDGGGYTLTGAQIESGTFLLTNVTLQGVHGVGDEDGGAGLALLGDGAVAVLGEGVRALGGTGGPEALRGGAGVLLCGEGQGLILRADATATGGVGRTLGGSGVQVEGCGCEVIVTDDVSLLGREGQYQGGAGLEAAACTSLKLSGAAAVTGGGAVYNGGAGLLSGVCEACALRGSVSLEGQTMFAGGVGQVGGNAVTVARQSPESAVDVSLAGQVMLLGGAGETGGSGLAATLCRVSVEGDGILCSAGNYLLDGVPALKLDGCEVAGDLDAVSAAEGVQLDYSPGVNVSNIVANAIGQRSDRYEPTLVENGLTERELFTRYNNISVESGRVTQAAVNGGGLRITMRDGTYEQRLEYQQRLMSDGAEGTRLVLIASSSQEWITVESTVAALEKLLSLGVTQLAYTTVAPTYYERILDLQTVVDAVHADGEPVERVLFGTADDCVVFLREDGEWDYQESLMAEVVRPLEAAPEAEEAAENADGDNG